MAAVCTSLLLGACAAPSGEYPSLAIRDAEIAAQTSAETPDPAPPASVAQAVLERLATLTAQAQESHAIFTGAAPVATRLIRAGAGQSMSADARASAEIALADLLSIRSQTTIPLADLDLMLVEASNAFEPTAEITQARNLVARLVQEEDRVIAEMRDLLAR